MLQTNIAAAFGMGLLALLVYLNHTPMLEVGFIILALLFISLFIFMRPVHIIYTWYN